MHCHSCLWSLTMTKILTLTSLHDESRSGIRRSMSSQGHLHQFTRSYSSVFTRSYSSVFTRSYSSVFTRSSSSVFHSHSHPPCGTLFLCFPVPPSVVLVLFLDHHMPGFPLWLLRSSSDGSFLRWYNPERSSRTQSGRTEGDGSEADGRRWK